MVDRGETNLQLLLQSMEPIFNSGEYVFCTITTLPTALSAHEIIDSFQEKEGLTLILKKEVADRYNLAYNYRAGWITLAVHSSLSAVGLTAAVSTALAQQNISCNVIAGFYHDHIFVANHDVQRALAAIIQLSKNNA